MPTPASPRKTLRARLIALAAVVGVLLQGVVPVAHPARAAAPDHGYAAYAAVFGGAADLLLCGADTGDTKPAKPDPARHRALCPLCLAAQHPASFLAPAGITIPAPALGARHHAQGAVALLRPATLRAAAQARAPPRGA